jgi:hypothetical protein
VKTNPFRALIVLNAAHLQVSLCDAQIVLCA